MPIFCPVFEIENHLAKGWGFALHAPHVTPASLETLSPDL
nr:MAG TPA: hypothetical protein [Caudoviricetes sp.]